MYHPALVGKELLKQKPWGLTQKSMLQETLTFKKHHAMDSKVPSRNATKIRETL